MGAFKKRKIASNSKHVKNRPPQSKTAASLSSTKLNKWRSMMSSTTKFEKKPHVAAERFDTSMCVLQLIPAAYVNM